MSFIEKDEREMDIRYSPFCLLFNKGYGDKWIKSFTKGKEAVLRDLVQGAMVQAYKDVGQLLQARANKRHTMMLCSDIDDLKNGKFPKESNSKGE